MAVIWAIGFAVVVAVVVGVSRRRAASDVQTVRVEGGKPWAGPARLNGSVRVRHPGSVPRPMTLMEAAAPTDVPLPPGAGRHRARRREPRLSRALLAWVLFVVALVVWVNVAQSLGWV